MAKLRRKKETRKRGESSLIAKMSKRMLCTQKERFDRRRATRGNMVIGGGMIVGAWGVSQGRAKK